MAASWGSALVIAATTFSASGSISAPHAGRVSSTHSTRDHAAVRSMPEGSSVTWSSHRSASRSDSATAVRSASDVGWVPVASWLIAPCRARSQFTGPPDQLISFCSSANSGILPEQVLGGAAAGDAAEQGAEAERVTRRVALGLAALGIAVGEPEAERGHVTHASTVDA